MKGCGICDSFMPHWHLQALPYVGISGPKIRKAISIINNNFKGEYL